MENEELYELEAAYNLIAEECTCGMRNVLTHIENLRTKMEREEERSPFEAIISRVKCYESTSEKCERKGWEKNADTFKAMHDIAGVRVIVPFLDDVYRVRDAITRRQNLKVDEERDYIKNPKPNGYRSLHLIVKTKVPFEYEDKWIPVEIQIRTKAQDFWSSMEHRLRYKNQDPAPETASEFAAFAEELYAKDIRMMKLRDFNKIESFIKDDNGENLKIAVNPEDIEPKKGKKGSKKGK